MTVIRKVLFGVDADLLDQFDALCRWSGVSRSEALRQFMRAQVQPQQDLVGLGDGGDLRSRSTPAAEEP